MLTELTTGLQQHHVFDGSIVTGRPNYHDMDRKSSVPRRETHDGDFIEPCEKESNDFAREHDTVEKFTLLYSGNIGRFHKLETAIDAIAKLEEQGRDDVQLLIIGEGAQK